MRPVCWDAWNACLECGSYRHEAEARALGQAGDEDEGGGKARRAYVYVYANIMFMFLCCAYVLCYAYVHTNCRAADGEGHRSGGRGFVQWPRSAEWVIDQADQAWVVGAGVGSRRPEPRNESRREQAAEQSRIQAHQAVRQSSRSARRTCASVDANRPRAARRCRLRRSQAGTPLASLATSQASNPHPWPSGSADISITSNINIKLI